MMKKIIFLVGLFFCFALFGYDAVKFRGGNDNVLNTESVFFSDDVLTIEGKEVNPETVSHILFHLDKPKELRREREEFGEIRADELLKRASFMEQKYPDAKLLVLYDEGIERLEKNGKQYSRSRYAVKIRNESQLNLATLRFGSQKGKTETKLLFARSISPDGKVYYLDLEDVSYTTPSRGRDFFGNDKEFQILQYTIPEVGVGSIIDYEYERVILSSEDPEQYYVGWFFSSEDPVYESKLKIMLPQNKEFHFAEMNIDSNKMKKNEYTENGYKIYDFQYGRSDPVIREENGPKISELVAYIKGSPFLNQNYLSGWLGKFFKERLQADDEIRKTVNQILEGVVEEEEKVALLYRYMQENIRYVSIKTSLSSGLAGHKAVETFVNRYGDCIDKAILFATMLESAGIEAYPVIVMTNNFPQPLYERLGVLDGNHAINEIHLKNGKIIYLDSTANYYRYPFFRYDDHGIYAWNPLKNTVRNTGYPRPEDEAITITLNMKLSSNGSAVIEERTETRGNQEVGYRNFFLNAPEDYKKATLEQFASGSFPKSRLLDYAYDDPKGESKDYSFQYRFQTESAGTEVGNFYLISIEQPFSFDFITPIDRKTPIFFPSVLKKTHQGSIEIPDNCIVKGLPAELVVENPYLHYKGRFREKGNVIYYENVYIRRGTKIPTKDYSLIREAMIQIDNYIKTPIVLEKRK